MTTAEDIVYLNGLRSYQRLVIDGFLIPAFNRSIDTAWACGLLLLPDFSWGLREPWYVGDLR